jgi:diguanylate cyclase (GGDEF)-like protein
MFLEIIDSKSKSLDNERIRVPEKTAKNVRRYLLILLVVLPILVITSLQWYSVTSNEKVLLQQARLILNNATTESQRHTDRFLNNAIVQAQVGAGLVNAAAVNVDNFEQIEAHLLVLLENHPEFAGLSFAKADGSYLYTSRDEKLANSGFLVKYIDASQPIKLTKLWRRHSASVDKHDERVDENDDFDPRKRSWYVNAVLEKQLVWTDPYVFFTVKRFGVTSSMPLLSAGGDVVGVIGIDLELAELSEFLGKLQISQSGSSFIVTDDGVLVGSSGMADEFKSIAGSDQAYAINVMHSDYPVPKAAFQAVFSEQGNSSFSIDGKDYLVDSMQVEISAGKHWTIVTYADQNDFLLAIRDNEQKKLWLAIVAVALAIVLGGLLTKTVWRPVVVLEGQANTDPLTGVYNRRFLQVRAEELIATAVKHERPLSLAFLDLDRFKVVNDTHGHDVGDEVLKVFVDRIKNQLRSIDLFARFGGEEFVVMLPNLDKIETAQAIDNVRKAIHQPYQIGDLSIDISFSAGVASLSSVSDSYTALLKAADQALYKAKECGRDQVVTASAMA